MRDSAILVTGGAGFIGSHFIREWLAAGAGPVVNLDALTYASDVSGVQELAEDPRHYFVRGDIGDEPLVASLLAKYRPVAVVNFAAETHVDRSIRQPAGFIQTNVVGTMRLLETVRRYWAAPGSHQDRFRFIQISTDEVYGSLKEGRAPFDEQSAYSPNNPYSASKASADHLVRSWNRTYGFPSITLNCSNHYGPRQNQEKFIPLLIERGIAGEQMPIYGDGSNERDWLYVADGCTAMSLALLNGVAGETYTIGTGVSTPNIEVARKICGLLDELRPLDGGASHESLIQFVPDRPGHDRRYAVDSARLRELTGWKPSESMDSGLRKTVIWHLRHRAAVVESTAASGALRP